MSAAIRIDWGSVAGAVFVFGILIVGVMLLIGLSNMHRRR